MKLQGIAASNGYSIGVPVVVEETELIISKENTENVAGELDVLDRVITRARVQLEALFEKTKIDIGEEEALVFQSHLMMLDDPELIGMIKQKVETDKNQLPFAIEQTRDFFVSIFDAMDNEYMKARAADVKDVANRLIRLALGIEDQNLDLPDNAIIVANDLTPSDTAKLDKKKVIAFLTEVGSKTSHSAIMARSMGIPAVLGISNLLAQVKEASTDNTKMIVDGFTGEIFLNPTVELETDYADKIKEFEEEMEKLKIYKDVKLSYKDGRKVAVAGNIGSVDDLDLLIEQGAQGIGLFRTEFLFMGRDQEPTEEEQFNAYKTVAESMKEHPVVIRTLDIGGDKVIPYIEIPKEDNPFLGLRALRLCFKEIDLFKTQLKAILRAGVYGNLHVMFPMVGSLDELTRAKEVLEECKEELKSQDIPFKEDIPVGMMIEIPAAAVSAKLFAEHVDFFSIGTNDLVQYTLAVDRMNPEVSDLYNPFHPSVLGLIKTTIDAAHEAGIWCGMCGEMASDPEATQVLAEFGLDEFSVTGSSVLRIKAELNELDITI